MLGSENISLEDLMGKQISVWLIIALVFLLACIAFLEWWCEVFLKAPESSGSWLVLWLPALFMIAFFGLGLVLGLPPSQAGRIRQRALGGGPMSQKWQNSHACRRGHPVAWTVRPSRDRRNSRAQAILCKFAVLIVSCVLASSVHAAQLDIGTSFWPPYVDPKLRGQGLAISIVTAAFERVGYKPVVTIRPWEQTLQETRLGHSAVIAAAWKTAARENDFVFSDPYLVNEIKFVKRRGTKPRFATLSDLAGLRVGVVYLYAYEEAFDADTRFVKVSETQIVPNLLQLLAGNIDLTVGDERALRYEISRHLQDRKAELEFLATPLAARDLYVAASRLEPQAETIIRDFNRGLEEIRQNGTYRKLLRQANEEIWKKSYLRP